MFKEQDRVTIFEYANPGYVSIYNPWVGNHSHKNRHQMIADIATISYGNDSSKNPTALYNKLIEVKHLSVFEFMHTGQTNNFGIQDSLRHQIFDTYDDLKFSPADVALLDKYFMKNAACFKIKVPIIVARQFMRHRAFSYLEMSRRYVKDSKVPFEFITDNDPECKKFNDASVIEYNRRIANGEKPETARGCIGTDAYTEFFAMTDYDGLQQFFNLRLDAHAQKYIRETADGMLTLLKKHQPELANRITDAREDS